MRRTEPTESQIEKGLFEWLAYHKNIGDFAFKITNEAGSRSAYEMKSLVNRGLREGFPDIGIMIPNDDLKLHGCFIELKTKTGRVSNAQKIWLERLTSQGYLAKVCYGLDSAIETINMYIQS
jgi:hypothetical protein